jgi:hypothetical protein
MGTRTIAEDSPDIAFVGSALRRAHDAALGAHRNARQFRFASMHVNGEFSVSDVVGSPRDRGLSNRFLPIYQ